jgi:hypothetical protein
LSGSKLRALLILSDFGTYHWNTASISVSVIANSVLPKNKKRILEKDTELHFIAISVLPRKQDRLEKDTELHSHG